MVTHDTITMPQLLAALRTLSVLHWLDYLRNVHVHGCEWAGRGFVHKKRGVILVPSILVHSQLHAYNVVCMPVCLRLL